MGWAANKQAQIARSQWRDYKQRFMPVENELIDLINNQGELSDELARTDSLVTSAYDSSRDQRARRNERYNVQVSPEQEAAYQRQSALDQARTAAEAANRVRQRDYERDMAVMGGGLSSITQRGQGA